MLIHPLVDERVLVDREQLLLNRAEVKPFRNLPSFEVVSENMTRSLRISYTAIWGVEGVSPVSSPQPTEKNIPDV